MTLTKMSKNPEAVKAMLEAAGIDASIVDRPAAVQASASAPTTPIVPAHASGGGGKVAGELANLERTAQYQGGWTAESQPVLWFWDSLQTLSPMEQRALCHLLTGDASRLPPALRIAKAPTTSQQIAVLHDAQRPTLALPHYTTKAELAASLRESMLASFLSAVG